MRAPDALDQGGGRCSCGHHAGKITSSWSAARDGLVHKSVSILMLATTHRTVVEAMLKPVPWRSSSVLVEAVTLKKPP